MADRPAQICQLEKGKLIDTNQGFVDTFNWVAKSMANLKGGENCEVSWTLPDHPQIDVKSDDGDGSGGGAGAAVYDIYDTTHNNTRALEIEYTDNRANKYIDIGSGGISSITAGSNNPDAQFDATNQDYLTYTDSGGSSVNVALPYINAVADLEEDTDQVTGDRQLNWSYTRSNASVVPIDLGVEFVDDTGQNTTDVHSKFTLKSAQDSNVEFTFNGGEITVGVYYI